MSPLRLAFYLRYFLLQKETSMAQNTLQQRLPVAMLLPALILLIGFLPPWRPAVATPTVTATPCTSDEFNSSALSPSWAWVDPLGDSSFSLTANAGALRIQTPSGNHDLYPPLPTNAPRITQSVSGDFDISTKVTIIPNNTFQAAGLLVWFSDTNFMWIGRSDSDAIQKW
jgi:hypothetical protein